MPQPLFCCFCSFVLCAEIILKYAAVQDNDWSYVAVQGGWDDGWPASMLLQFKVCALCRQIDKASCGTLAHTLPLFFVPNRRLMEG